MLPETIQKLNNLFENNDIEGLKALAVPSQRTQNSTLDFKSAMMLSCHNIKHLSKIASLDAGCIILNLEDGVSLTQKPYALVLCAITLASHRVNSKKLVVRINPLNEGGEEEILYLNDFKPDAIRVPKIRMVEDVRRALELIDPTIEVHLSIETKEAWLALETLALSSRITVYYLGILDLLADLRLSQSLLESDNPTISYILSRFLIISRACGIKPVSFVFQEHTNDEKLQQWLLLEKKIGYDAKGCISPTQAKFINEIFKHNNEEVIRCQEIVRLFEEYQSRNISGFVDKRYGFIDEPIYKGALAVLKDLVI